MRYHILPLILGLLVSALSGARAAAPKDKYALGGIKKVCVIVEELQPETAGLTLTRLRQIVRQSVIGMGLRVISEKEWGKDKTVPVVYLNVNTMGLKVGGKDVAADCVVYNISLHVRQGTRLVRNPKQRCLSITWDRFETGFGDKPHIETATRGLLNDLAADLKKYNVKVASAP